MNPKNKALATNQTGNLDSNNLHNYTSYTGPNIHEEDPQHKLFINYNLPLRTSRPQYVLDRGTITTAQRYYPEGIPGLATSSYPKGFDLQAGNAFLAPKPPGFYSADTTVPSKFDTIQTGIPNSSKGDLPENMPHDYRMNYNFAASSLPPTSGTFNDLVPSIQIPGESFSTTSKPGMINYYNRSIEPINVSPQDRQTIDNYLKTQGKIGPLQKVAHQQETLRPDQLYYGDQYDRRMYVPPFNPVKDTLKEIPNTIKNIGTSAKNLILNRKL